MGFLNWQAKTDRRQSVLGIGKRGQLQIQETILSIFIIIIIIVIGMTVFFRYQEASLKSSSREYKLEQAGNRILTMPDSSEFVYSEAGVKRNAVDVMKIGAFQSLVQKKRKYYNSQLGFMKIEVKQVYPEKIDKKCEAGQINDCGVWEIYSNVPKEKTTTFKRNTPVSLYFPNTGNYVIGLLSVEVYNV